MGTLEKVTQMKNEGKTDNEIKNALKEQRISPKEILDALNQAKIKNAVSNSDELQPSIMEGGEEPISNNENIYTPKTQEMQQEDLYVPTPQDDSSQDYEEPQQNYYPTNYQEPAPQDYYSQEQNYGAQDYYSQAGAGSDLMIEIAEQVFAKKIREIVKHIENLSETKELMKSKVEDASNRLDRIEKTMDKLQIAILEKVGSYGRNIESVKKEMSMMQNSFGKIVNRAVAANAPKITPQKISSLPKKEIAPVKKIVKKKSAKKKIRKKSIS